MSAGFTRRKFLASAVGLAPLLILKSKAGSSQDTGFDHDLPEWKSISKGLRFARMHVYKNKTVVETVGILKIDPAENKIRVFNTYEPQKTVVRTIDEWQAQTKALGLINSAQYMADPYYMPCALVICDGKQKGPRNNKSVRGMLVSEPSNSSVPKADLLDFEYDRFDPETTPYTQGVQHWPILLDRHGKIKVKKTDLKSYRTVVAIDKKGEILFLTTEGNYFSLYNFAEFLRSSNSRRDHGLDVRTAMNMDGGDEANMIVKTDQFSYLSYTERLKRNGEGNGSIFNWKARLPGVIGVFAR